MRTGRGSGGREEKEGDLRKLLKAKPSVQVLEYTNLNPHVGFGLKTELC
jgi:hypothetical protein